MNSWRGFTLSLLVTFVVLFFVPSHVMGKSLLNRNSVSFSGGALSGDTLAEIGVPGFDRIEVDDGFLFTFRYEYGVTDNVGLELTIGGATSDTLDIGSAFPGGEFVIDTNQLLLNGGIVYNITYGKFVPFLVGGIGIVSITGDIGAITIEETDFSFNFGGGLKVFATDSFFLRVDIRDHVVYPEDAPPVESETLHLVELSGGIGFTW